jgi:endonuclease YncB( thermonuclease family)
MERFATILNVHMRKSYRSDILLASLLLAGAALLFPAPVKAAAQAAKYPYSIEGRVVGVTDGDTIKVLRGKTLYKVRLNGIDAPEQKQAYGRKAKDFLASLVFERQVEVIVRDMDRYGRYVGDVMVGGKSANAALVAAGLAWQYTEYSKDPSLAALQKMAKSKRIGLWIDAAPLPPWEFRRKK